MSIGRLTYKSGITSFSESSKADYITLPSGDSMQGTSGYLALDDKIFRFDSARWSFRAGHLYLEAESRRCWLSLVGVPFTGATQPEELVGKAWAPEWDAFSPGDDIFAEGGLEIRDERFAPLEIRVEVRSYSAETGVMKVAISMKVEGEDSGYSGDVDCHLACEPESQGE